jgi:hypothetical protein
MKPFRCRIVLEVIQGEGAEAIRDGIAIFSALGELSRCDSHAGRIVEIGIREAAPSGADAATVRAPRRKPGPKPGRRAPVAQPPAAINVAQPPSAVRKRRKPRAAGGPPPAAPAADKPAHTCEHCGGPMSPKAPRHSRFCSKPECGKAKQREYWHSLPKERRIEIIRQRYARLKARRRAAEVEESGGDEEGDATADEERLLRNAGGDAA